MTFLENVYNLGLTFFIWNFNLLSFYYSDASVSCYGHKNEEWGLLERSKIDIDGMKRMKIHEWNETSYILATSHDKIRILGGKFARYNYLFPREVDLSLDHADQMFPTPGILHLF